MSGFRIAIDLGHLLPPTTPLTAQTFPALSFAVQRVAEAAQAQWVAYASGEPMPNGKVIGNRTGEYQRSILLRQLGDFSAQVYSDLLYAQAIEEGSPARDLTKMLSSSLKVRLTKDGRRYLIIPFRHNAPGSLVGNAMPKQVMEWWKDNKAGSSILGTYDRPSGTGAFDRETRKRTMVQGWRYNWGDRLHRDDLRGMTSVGEHQAKRLAGMVHFRQPGASGGSSHGQFITFRVMVEGSPGWKVPPQEGKWPAKQTAAALEPVAKATFRRAMEEDIAALIPGATT